MKIHPILKNALVALCLSLSGITLAEPVTLPTAHAITDNTGRTIQGTIVSKTDTDIKFRRASDGLEVKVPLNKLSENDRSYIAGAINETAIPATSTITLQVEVKTRQTPGKPDDLESTTTPVFVRGRDMDDSPAFIRISRVQTNVDEEDKNIMSDTFVETEVKPVILGYPIQKKNPITRDWFAEVWQNGRLICKSYQNSRIMGKLAPPSKVGNDTVMLHPKSR